MSCNVNRQSKQQNPLSQLPLTVEDWKTGWLPLTAGSPDLSVHQHVRCFICHPVAGLPIIIPLGHVTAHLLHSQTQEFPVCPPRQGLGPEAAPGTGAVRWRRAEPRGRAAASPAADAEPRGLPPFGPTPTPSRARAAGQPARRSLRPRLPPRQRPRRARAGSRSRLVRAPAQGGLSVAS